MKLAILLAALALCEGRPKDHHHDKGHHGDHDGHHDKGHDKGTKTGDTVNNFIVGGEVVHDHWFEIVALEQNGHFCGGTIYDSTTIITAAHCADAANANRLSIRCGTYDRNSNGHSHNCHSIIIHQGYSSSTLDNDIAIIKLQTPIEYDEVTEPIGAIDEIGSFFEGEELHTAGWGTTTSGGAISSVLREVTVHFVTNDDCNNAYSGGITSNMICAALPGKDACQGDSGGPLTRHVNGVHQLVGITSWGFGCADASYPGVYARVHPYTDFIKANAA